MRRMWGVAGIMAIGTAVGLGCSNDPPPIQHAKAVPGSNTDKPVELPPMTPPDKFDAAAKAIVDDAIKAHTGGKPELLQKLKSVEYTREGQALAGGQLPISSKWLIHAAWPNRVRFHLEMSDRPINVLCRNGDKVWQSSGGTKFEPPDDFARDFRIDATSEWLWMLFPLTEPSTVLAMAPETTANTRPAVGVRIWANGVTDAILHFDKETKLLVRITFEGRESRRKVTKELAILTHKTFHGLTLPDKMILKADGTVLAEWNTTALDFRPTIDAKVFENP